MMGKNFIYFNSRFSLLVQLTTFLILLLLAGCASGSYGKLDRDRDLDNMFLNYEVLPDHHYYITGGYTRPTAILAIDKQYELVNAGNLWIGVPNVDSGQMRIWIETINPDENYRYSGVYFAAYILAPDGKRVGALFSIENLATIKFLGENKIEVYPPQSRQYFDNRRGLMFQNGRY
jgi:hypothetical protein